jgi:hypothetical protein
MASSMTRPLPRDVANNLEQRQSSRSEASVRGSERLSEEDQRTIPSLIDVYLKKGQIGPIMQSSR